MSQTISITDRPSVRADVKWRWDGEVGQIIVLSRDDLALPLILNPTAARIFSLCDSSNSIEEIAMVLCDDYTMDDFGVVLEDVKKQIDFFIEKNIIKF